MNKFLLFNELLRKSNRCFAKKKYLIALKYINQAIFLNLTLSNQKIRELYELRGNIKIQMNQYLDCIGDFNKAISLDPKNPSLYFYRGFALCVLDEKEGALKDFNKLIEFEPDNKSAIEISRYLKDSLGNK